MKYLSNLAIGIAALALAASCSNDEPANNGGTQIPEGQQAFMRINIQSADNGGRSTVIGGYEYGDGNEHKVSNAHFYFFDKEGIYVGTASIWKNGAAVTDPEQGGNIEYIGGNVIVLDNLESNQYPSYILTVLNRPDSFNPTAGQTAAQITRELAQFGALGNFVMSTSSYYTPAADVAADDHHDNKFPYLTKVLPGDFLLQPAGSTPAQSDIDKLQQVKIYVERLAAKIQLAAVNANNTETATDGETTLYKIDATVAGDPNEQIKDPMAGTQLYVKILGWDINNTVNNSYISKQLLPAWETTAPFANWQPTYSDHRSFWAESWVYSENVAGEDGAVNPIRPEASAFTYKSYNELAQAVGDVAYCNENTNTPLNIGGTALGEGANTVYAIKPNFVTSILVKAQITDKSGTGVNLVNHNGMLFTFAQYKAYVLGAMKADYALPYYIKTGDGATAVYTQLGANLADFDFASVAGSASLVKVQYVANPAIGTLWKRTGGNETDGYTYTAATVGDVNNALNDYQANIQVEGFKGGDMYYNIPIEHFANNGDNQLAEDAEGYYGVVRNHWYKVNIAKVLSIGHGVFDPDQDIVIDQEDPKHRYYLAAQINILSWKIITQSADI